jgi:hypothetical protein
MYSVLKGFMEEMIETFVSHTVIWKSWERAHDLQEGKEGKNRFHYKIFDVKKGESFSILWKSLFVRMVFTQSVYPAPQGSRIVYKVQVKGLFGWAVKLLSGKKIKKSVSEALQTLVSKLEKS